LQNGDAYMKTFYYVVVTATTLGYGEITPDFRRRDIMF